MANKINILVVEPGKSPRPARVEASEDAFEKLLGGTMEYGCYLPNRVMLFSRENALEDGLPFNRVTSMDGFASVNIFGPFLLCGFKDDGYISLTIAQQKEFQMHFAKPGRPATASV